RIASGTLALPDGPFFPVDAEPREIGEDCVLAPRHVALGVGVVDPQQHPVTEGAVGNRTQGVADVERAGGAGGKAHSSHSEPKVTVPAMRESLLAWFEANARDLRGAGRGSLRDPRLGGDASADDLRTGFGRIDK